MSKSTHTLLSLAILTVGTYMYLGFAITDFLHLNLLTVLYPLLKFALLN